MPLIIKERIPYGGTGDGVHYIEQTLTEEQKTQARKNIGAAASKEVGKLSEEIEDLENLLDLKVAVGKQIFDKDHPNILDNVSLGSTGISSFNGRKSIVLPIDNTKGFLTVNCGDNRGKAYYGAFTVDYPSVGVEIQNFYSVSASGRTYVIPPNAKYFIYHFYKADADTLTPEQILSTLMIEYGSNYTGYEAYEETKSIDVVKASTFSMFDLKKVCASANVPMITFTVDPGRGFDNMKSFKSLCDSKGVKCTIGLLGDVMNNPVEYDGQTITAKEMYLKWMEEGYHICLEGHTHGSHWSKTDSNYDEIEKDIVLNKQELQNAGFVDFDYLIAPNGNANSETIVRAKKWTECLIKTTGLLPYNVGYGEGRYSICRTFIMSDASGGKGLDGYKADIDGCIANNGWLVFGLHTVTTSSGDEYDESLLSSVIDYALSKNVPIYTFNQAFKIRKPLYDMSEIFG